MVTGLQNHTQLAQLGMMNQTTPSAKGASKDGDGDHGVEPKAGASQNSLSAAATGLGRHIDVRA